MRCRTALVPLVLVAIVTAILLCQHLRWNGYGLWEPETKLSPSVSGMKNPFMRNETADFKFTWQPRSQYPPRFVWHVPLVEKNVHPGSVNNDVAEINRLNSAPTATILFWTLYGMSKPDKYGCGRTPFLHYQCPVNSCAISTNKSLMTGADVVLFYVYNPDLSLP